MYPFQPDDLETRRLFARALFRAFGTALEMDPAVTFNDLPIGRPLLPLRQRRGRAGVDARPTRRLRSGRASRSRRAMVHRALVLALGLGDLAAGADALHMRDGTPIPTPRASARC